ncbi:MAG: LysM peptidoglycan-binding domain-containing protein [Anaerolineaceae bacterium]|nr:LysM peptidoglycan-binding domain-containing protein [Anaerolineaceae bacterium]
MSEFHRQMLIAIAASLLFTVLVGGGLILSLNEHTSTLSVNPTATEALSTPLPTIEIDPNDPVREQNSPTEEPTLTASSPALTPTMICQAPASWMAYTITRQDTLEQLSLQTGSQPSWILKANCLDTNDLTPGQIIYLPPFITATSVNNTPTADCGRPNGWSTYQIQSGDTLFSISQRYYTSVSALQTANCMNQSTQIFSGDRIWVPSVAATATITTPSATATREQTRPLESTPSLTPSPDATGTQLASLSPTPSVTPVTPTQSLTPVTPSPTQPTQPGTPES